MGEFAAVGAVHSDFTFIEDLADFEMLLKNQQIKTMVTGGLMSVNQKFRAIREVYPRTSFLSCANKFNMRAWANADPGVTNRFHILACRSRRELVTPKSDNRPMFVWERLAKQCNTTIPVLAMWLLRCATNSFLKAIGYDPTTLKAIAPNRLEEIMEANRANYVMSTELTHVQQLTEGMANLVAITCANDPTFKHEDLALLSNLPFSWEIMTAFLSQAIDTAYVDQVKTNPDAQQLRRMKVLAALDVDSVDFIGQFRVVNSRLSEWSNAMSNKNNGGFLEYLLGQVVARNGFGFPSRDFAYTPHWEMLMKEVEYLYIRAKNWASEKEDLCVPVAQAVAVVRPVVVAHIKNARAKSALASLKTSL